MNIVERAKKRWNDKADKLNQWCMLDMDEILDLIIEQEKIDNKMKLTEEEKEILFELMCEAINLYSDYPNNFKMKVEKYFKDEIKLIEKITHKKFFEKV